MYEVDAIDDFLEEGPEALDEQQELLPSTPDSPTPHKEKLDKLSKSKKLPAGDKDKVDQAIKQYGLWIKAMDDLKSQGDTLVKDLVDAVNSYKKWIELDLIWDSESNFLFRQKGQLKLDNSIIEEFLPRLVDPRIIPSLEGKDYQTGPRRAFSAAYFATSITDLKPGAGLQIRRKDQDFTVSRTAYLRSSYGKSFSKGTFLHHEIALAFVAAECKTNLDKTMFQEAIATAHDVKVAIPGSRHYLLCEWLDMPPISTKGTDIDEVIILRGKRMGSELDFGHS